MALSVASILEYIWCFYSTYEASGEVGCVGNAMPDAIRAMQRVLDMKIRTGRLSRMPACHLMSRSLACGLQAMPSTR